MANQFVVQLKNVPGAMAILAEELAERGGDTGGQIGIRRRDQDHVLARVIRHRADRIERPTERRRA